MPEKSQCDLLVHNGYIITMNDSRHVIDGGSIAIHNGSIAGVGTDGELSSRFDPVRRIDAGGAAVHPGLIECHMHASLQLVRGALPDDLPEDDVLEAFYYPYWNTVTDEEEYLAVVLSSMEMIRNGTTCFLEAGSVFEPSSAAEAAQFVGIRALVGDAFIWDRPGDYSQGQGGTSQVSSASSGRIERAPSSLDEALGSLGHELRRNADPEALVRGHIALWGMGTASDELLMAARARANEANVVVNMHQSYSPADVEVDTRRSGLAPIVHFADMGFLGPNVTFAHANYVSEDELAKVSELEASLVWAPAASMMWGHGGCFHGRHAELKRSGGNVAFGSDSSNWSNDFDIFKQAYLAVLATRESRGDRASLDATDVLEMATIGGARAVGLQQQIGRLEVGKRADLVIHTLGRPEAIPTLDIVRNLIYSDRSKSVDTVIVNGRVILEHGQFAHFDEKTMLDKINRAAKGTMDRMGYEVFHSWPVA